MSFDQDPAESVTLSGADFAMMKDEIERLRNRIDTMTLSSNSLFARAEDAEAKLRQMTLALRQLLDIWDAGMPDETARQDMVEAFAAVSAMFTISGAR